MAVTVYVFCSCSTATGSVSASRMVSSLARRAAAGVADDCRRGRLSADIVAVAVATKSRRDPTSSLSLQQRQGGEGGPGCPEIATTSKTREILIHCGPVGTPPPAYVRRGLPTSVARSVRESAWPGVVVSQTGSYNLARVKRDVSVLPVAACSCASAPRIGFYLSEV
eukprot:scaffold137156_cov127-Phaeocystis_antarctica.AAC.1